MDGAPVLLRNAQDLRLESIFHFDRPLLFSPTNLTMKIAFLPLFTTGAVAASVPAMTSGAEGVLRGGPGGGFSELSIHGVVFTEGSKASCASG